MTNEKYLTASEAASYLRTSRSTLAKRRMNGCGPAFVRIGRAVRYRLSDLDAWMGSSVSLFGRPASAQEVC
jgi:excisionase family DNA binding protein